MKYYMIPAEAFDRAVLSAGSQDVTRGMIHQRLIGIKTSCMTFDDDEEEQEAIKARRERESIEALERSHLG